MNIISSSYNPFNILYDGITYLWRNEPNNYIKRPNIDDIKKLKLIIFNMDGVLCIGEKPIIIARETFNSLVKRKTPICITTNDSRRSPKRIKKNLTQMGFHINDNVKIITTGLLMLYHISSLINPLTYHIINRQTKSEYKKNRKYVSSRKLNFAIIGEQDFFHYIKHNTLNRYENVKFNWIYDDIEPNNIDYFIIGSLDSNENLLKIKTQIVKWIKLNPSARFVITDPSTSTICINNNDAPSVILPKRILQIIKDEFAREEPRFTLIKQINLNMEYPTKPTPDFIKEELSHYYGIKLEETNRNDIIVVGDNIETDIELGDNLNCFKSLVLSGVTKHNDLYKLNENERDNIDYIIPDVSYLIL